MKSNTRIKRLAFLSCLAGIMLTVSSFVPSPVKFYPMLMKKADVDKLMANSSFSYLILVNSNNGVEDNLRLSYKLVCYAYTGNNQLIATFNPLQLTTSVSDSSYTKNVYLSNYKITKSSLSTLIPSASYSFLRFAPYGDRTDPLLANFISYSVLPVAADGVTGVLKGKGVPIIKLNPSPPH